MAIKKVSFKHFDKSRLTTINFSVNPLKTFGSDAEVEKIQVPIYFRITYDRKTTTLKSLFLSDAFRLVEGSQNKESESKIPVEWEKLKQKIIDLDRQVLDLYTDEFFINTGFDFDSFKLFYIAYSASFTKELDRDIVREILELCLKHGFHQTANVIKTCLYYNYEESSRSQIVALNTHKIIGEMLDELNPKIKEKIYSDRIWLKIKLLNVLLKLNKISISDGSFGFSYFPFIYLRSAKWKPRLDTLLTENFSINEIEKIKILLDSDLTSPKFYPR